MVDVRAEIWDRFYIHKLQGQKHDRASSQSALALSAVTVVFLAGHTLQHVKALNVSRPLGQILTLRYLIQKSYHKKIVADLSESCVTTEFTPGDFHLHLDAFSRMIPCQPGNCLTLPNLYGSTVAFPFLAITLDAVNQRHEGSVASKGVFRRARRM